MHQSINLDGSSPSFLVYVVERSMFKKTGIEEERFHVLVRNGNSLLCCNYKCSVVKKTLTDLKLGLAGVGDAHGIATKDFSWAWVIFEPKKISNKPKCLAQAQKNKSCTRFCVRECRNLNNDFGHWPKPVQMPGSWAMMPGFVGQEDGWPKFIVLGIIGKRVDPIR